ncbi:MAG: RNA methyltransferase [Chloroflexi bacterium HGW-Chloroflexi-10]|nr:MAG: RNA methyltransferase [Chloroflexi bacterium HGW-Chloroflexi-10]
MNTISKNKYLIRACPNPDCNFRFPAPDQSGIGVQCPKCKSLTLIKHEFNLNQEAISQISEVHSNPKANFEVILDNIRSTFNVGAMFRTSDGAGVRKIHLCGITALPQHKKIHKTALGAETSVPFEYHLNGIVAVNQLKEQGFRIWALEKTSISRPLEEFHFREDIGPVAMVVGNEVIGVDPDILKLCDDHIHIPMSGVKGSLNVAIAFGIAVYQLLGFQDSTGNGKISGNLY